MLVEQIKAFVIQTQENYTVMRQRVMDKAASANNDLEPTVDKYDRFHAPCDGYVWDGDVYHGGAYLPLPDDFYEMLSEMKGRVIERGSSSFGYKTRFKSTPEQVSEIAQACGNYAKVSAGKTWDSGNECYCYIETPKKGLSDLIDAYEKEQVEARRALKGTAPEDLQTVEGKILSFKTEGYGFYNTAFTTKMLVELDNKSTVYGTLPASICEAERGDRVRFKAQFTPTTNDSTHAFFKRPRNASIITEESTKC